MATDNRTGPAVQKLVEAVQEDVSEALDLMQRGLDKIRVLEGQSKGINGLSGTLKAKGDEVALAITVIREEAEAVGKKMLREPKAPVIHQHVDKERAAAVAAAKEMGA